MTPAPDTAAMRQTAAQLADRAEQIRSVMGRLDARIGLMTYVGPAADEFRASVAEQRSMLDRTHGLLRQAADELVQGAARADATPPGFPAGG